jgi:hypothetical protein
VNSAENNDEKKASQEKKYENKEEIENISIHTDNSDKDHFPGSPLFLTNNIMTNTKKKFWDSLGRSQSREKITSKDNTQSDSSTYNIERRPQTKEQNPKDKARELNNNQKGKDDEIDQPWKVKRGTGFLNNNFVIYIY